MGWVFTFQSVRNGYSLMDRAADGWLEMQSPRLARYPVGVFERPENK